MSDEPGLPRIRVAPEDFVVEELPLFEPEGEGPHTYLCVEKRLANTEDVARALARAFDVAPRDVGYAGRKDRFAVTRQWFSVPDVDPAQADGLDLAGSLRGEGQARVTAAIRHRHKLRTGQLRGNRFELRVCGLSPDGLERALGRVEAVRVQGFPNRFGAQRFGRDGGNLEPARQVLAGKTPRGLGRRQARFLVSALQAAVFNEVLRTRPLALDCLEVGEIAVVHASGGPFLVEDAELESERARRFEISPSGPIFGTRRLRPEGAAAEREAAAHDALGVPLPQDLVAPRGLRLKGARRALRARPEHLEAEAERGDLLLRFELEAGCYATVVLEELIGPFAEGAVRMSSQ